MLAGSLPVPGHVCLLFVFYPFPTERLAHLNHSLGLVANKVFAFDVTFSEL